MYTPEDRQKTRRAHLNNVISTLNTFALYHMAFRWGRRAVAGNGTPCAAWALEAGAGNTPPVRPALRQQARIMLFLQLNP